MLLVEPEAQGREEGEGKTCLATKSLVSLSLGGAQTLPPLPRAVSRCCGRGRPWLHCLALTSSQLGPPTCPIFSSKRPLGLGPLALPPWQSTLLYHGMDARVSQL